MRDTIKKFTLGMAAAMAISLPFTAHAADATSFNPTTVKVTAKPISSIPVGTIIAWPVAQNPADMQNLDGSYNWLECNGQNFSQTVYPELFALLGGQLPDLRGRVTWGDTVPGKKIEAGLPNITGTFAAENSAEGTSGAFSHLSGPHPIQGPDGTDFVSYLLSFSAQRSNSIYGRSTTVQPPAYTVKYLIRARK